MLSNAVNCLFTSLAVRQTLFSLHRLQIARAHRYNGKLREANATRFFKEVEVAVSQTIHCLLSTRFADKFRDDCFE